MENTENPFSRILELDGVRYKDAGKGVLGVFHRDRKSTRLNSSHQIISYAVFCLKKKKAILCPTTHLFMDICVKTSSSPAAPRPDRKLARPNAPCMLRLAKSRRPRSSLPVHQQTTLTSATAHAA